MNSKIKVAVCGMGRIGYATHLPAIKKIKKMELCAVCDNNKELAGKAAKEFNVPSFSSYDEMLKDCGADMIVIATPSQMHSEMTIAALNKGFHVMVEKPMGRDFDESARMVEAAEKAGKILTVNQSMRYRVDALYLKKVIDSGMLGDVYSFYTGSNHSSERTDWQIWKKNNGGALADLGIHVLDAILFFNNSEPEYIFAKFHRILDKGDAEDSYKVSIKFKDGSVSECEMNTAAFSKPLWYVCGTKGTLIVENELPVSRFRFKPWGGREKLLKRFEDYYLKGSPSYFHYKDLVSRILKGQEPPVSTGQLLKLMKVVDCARKSDAEGKSICFERN
ncbi:MAG: hypothetical protein A2017_21795 [Lentisphaerae bacterium GWF2_44_16]|nr:MAG: hypothetical protein A2017_21795 [Lentisphaerae bacterium GWF2_44_16]